MNKTLKDTKTLVMLGLMLAITIILDFTPLGAIPVGPISATINHIPTIIAGIILGPVAGFIAGTSFGIVSFVHAFRSPLPFDLLFRNPLISILPRMFIGVTAYYAYAGIKGLFKKSSVTPVAIGIGAFVGSLTNTILVLGALALIYGGKIEAMLAEAGLGSTAIAWAIGIAGSNGLVEAIVCVVLVVPIALIYFRQFKS